MGVAAKLADSGVTCTLHVTPEGRAACVERAACLMKMEIFDIAADKYGWLFSLKLLLVVIANVPLAYGQQGNTGPVQIMANWQEII